MAKTDDEHRPILKKNPDPSSIEPETQSEKKPHAIAAMSYGKRILFAMMLCGNIFVFSGYSLPSPFFPHEVSTPHYITL